MASRNRFCRQYLQNLNALIFWFKYLQKVNAKCPQISDGKDNFFLHWSIFFSLFLKDQKLFLRDKTLFFHQKSEGILHLLFAGIVCKIYFLMPSNFDEKNAIVFWGQYPGNFETKFFPLRFEGISYNSVVTNFNLQ